MMLICDCGRRWDADVKTGQMVECPRCGQRAILQAQSKRKVDDQ